MAFSSVRRSLFVSSRNVFAWGVLLSAGAVLLSGCHQTISDPNDPKFIVAEKGTWKITREELNKEVVDFLKQHQTTPEQVGPSKMPIVETVTLKNMVLKKLLLDKAAALPPNDTDKEEAAELVTIKSRIPPGQDLDQILKSGGMTMDDLKKQIHEKVLIESVLKTEAFKNVEPSEQEIDAIYFKNKDSFTIPEKVRASRVLIHVDDKTSVADKAAKKKIIDKAHERVAHGEDFGKVATEVSEDQYSKTKGGDLGYFQKGENPDAGFDDVAFNTKQNSLSPVFLTPLGFQFLKVTAIQPAGLVPVADARNYISSKLRDHNRETQEQAYATKLMAESGVTYHLVLVDPPAQTAAPAPAPGGDESGGAPPPTPADSSAAPAPEQAPPPAAPDAQAPPPPASANK